jgi:hypothetical protein
MAKKSIKQTAKKTTNAKSETDQPRRVKRSSYKSFKPSKRIKHDDKPLLGSFKLFAKSIKLIKNNWRLFLVITLIYCFLSIILVRGVGGGLDLNNVKSSLKGGFTGQFSQLATGTVLFGYLLGSSGGSASPAAGTYQTILVILMSLIVIWALRQVVAEHQIKARDAFYNGTYPLVQFVLVLAVISLQLLPIAIGAWLYTAITRSGIATGGVEKSIWLLFFFLMALLSLYMISSSIFALYIVTLKDMTPMKALRSARALVLHRRFAVLRKVLFLPLAIIILGAVIMIPLILLLTPVAEWIFFALSMFVLVVVHSYMYSLYRELL